MSGHIVFLMKKTLAFPNSHVSTHFIFPYNWTAQKPLILRIMRNRSSFSPHQQKLYFSFTSHFWRTKIIWHIFMMLGIIYSRHRHFPLRRFLKRAFDSYFKKKWLNDILSIYLLPTLCFCLTKKCIEDRLTHNSKENLTKTLTLAQKLIFTFWINWFGNLQTGTVILSSKK